VRSGAHSWWPARWPCVAGVAQPDDPVFRPIVDQDLADRQHHNPGPVGSPESFTTAYFHAPDGLASEITRAGFAGVAVLGVEGPSTP
jgi:hypothetical protein